MVESTGFTVSALYEMLGLTASNKTSDDFVPLDEAEDPSTIQNNGSTLDNVHQFTANGPLLVRNAENPKKYIINPMYNAGLEILFNGQELTDDSGKKVGKMITKIDLAGTVTAIGKGSGLVKIQIGDNMNSSGWNIVDGKGSDGTVPDISTTNGRVPDDTGASFSMGNWETGTLQPFTKTASVSYTSHKLIKTKDTEVKEYKVYRKSDGSIVSNPVSSSMSTYYEWDGFTHLNDGDNIWNITVYGPDGTTVLRKAKVVDKVKANYSDKSIYPTELVDASNTKFAGSSTGTVVYTTGSNGISTSVISPMEVEFNYPSAVGARIIRKFTIDLSAIVPTGNRVKIVIELNGNTKEQTFFYLTSQTPTIANAKMEVEQDNAKYVWYSGVQYYGAGSTFKFSTSSDAISHLNNQMGVGSGNKLDLTDVSKKDTTTVSLFNTSTYGDIATGTFGTPTVNCSTVWNDKCDFSKTGIGVTANKYVTDPGISIKPINAFGSGTAVSGILANHLINTYTNSSTDLIEYFTSETYRRVSSSVGTLWGDTQKQTSLVGTTDLQVIPGVGLMYPSKNYTSFSPFKLNYASCSGDRSYVRLFKKAGSLPGGTLTFSHDTSIKAGLDAGNMRIYGSKDGVTWWDISYATPEDANTLGQAASTFGSTSSNIVFLWKDGDASGQFYVKVVMKKGFAPIITKIELK